MSMEVQVSLESESGSGSAPRETEYKQIHGGSGRLGVDRTEQGAYLVVQVPFHS